MADSLFDNRYRYDYIYPRGRSGETLRAVDTQANDRPVVIKRPAPNDAPPIRAGQEVSILNERKALQTFSRTSGSDRSARQRTIFRRRHGPAVHRHGARAGDDCQPISCVNWLQREERLPELEMLVIIDGLLDLLQTAHSSRHCLQRCGCQASFLGSRQLQTESDRLGQRRFPRRRRDHAAGHQPPE